MPRKPTASQRDPYSIGPKSAKRFSDQSDAETGRYGGYEPDDLSPAFERLRRAAENLPEVEAGLWYGTPALKVGKKSLCRVKDPDTVVLMCDLEEKEMLMTSAPGIYFETDHYKGWPAVLVRIHEIPADELAFRLERAWLRVAPRRLVKEWQSWTGLPDRV